MTAGLVITALGILLLLYAWISYKMAANSLNQIKQEDLISYYLDLAIKLLPLPFWCAVIGIVLLLIGLIVILINLPWCF